MASKPPAITLCQVCQDQYPSPLEEKIDEHRRRRDRKIQRLNNHLPPPSSPVCSLFLAHSCVMMDDLQVVAVCSFQPQPLPDCSPHTPYHHLDMLAHSQCPLMRHPLGRTAAPEMSNDGSKHAHQDWRGHESTARRTSMGCAGGRSARNASWSSRFLRRTECCQLMLMISSGIIEEETAKKTQQRAR